ncbi:hypothetical protein FRB93_000766, partial [Tulasnella sp. JGI-2019a]
MSLPKSTIAAKWWVRRENQPLQGRQVQDDKHIIEVENDHIAHHDPKDILAAKQFTILYDFNVPRPRTLLIKELTNDYDATFRFMDEDLKLEGMAREFDSLLPNRLRERRVELAERLEAVFSQGQQDARHSLTSRTRSELARIFGKEIGELVDNDGQRKDSQLLKGLLGFNAEKQTYALIPPFMRKYPETN